MKKSYIVIGIFILFVIIIFFYIQGVYNKIVRFDEQVKSQWSQVENVYQRRMDLIPNLVSTVKGYATFEKETLTQVIEARAKATSTTINAENLTPEALQNFQQAQGSLSSALSRLMVVVEKYPELKANQNFLDLQAQLEGTENRITIERMKFNESAQAYNVYIRQFPKNMFAAMFNFDQKAYFKADEGASNPPKVEF